MTPRAEVFPLRLRDDVGRLTDATLLQLQRTAARLVDRARKQAPHKLPVLESFADLVDREITSRLSRSAGVA